MSQILWQPAYKTGIKAIDEQHQALVKQINRLEQVAHKPDAEAEVHEVLSALTLYIRFHFKEEEQLMAEFGYNGLDRHAQLHQGFVHRVAEYLGRLKKGKSIPVSELLEFLKGWLINHILREDKKLSIYNRPAPTKSK